MFYKCRFEIDADSDSDSDSDDTLVVSAEPVLEDSNSDIVTLDAIVCNE